MEAAHEKEERLSIRANSSQKLTLARAAKAKHMNVSQFVLQASLVEAERVIADEGIVVVSPAEYALMCELMDRVSEAPRLRKALEEPAVWDA